MNRRPPPTVYVNGSPKEVVTRLYFDQVVRLAFGGVYVDDGAYAVTYSAPKAGRGRLMPRESITSEDGMTFEVRKISAEA